MDIQNKLSYHFIVASFSVLLTFFMFLSGISLGRSIAATAFILLFLVLAIGPVMKIWKPTMQALPWNFPWSWRGELGIWFFIFSILHVLFVFYQKQWDISGYIANMRLSDLIGFIALFLALILTITSFNRIIMFMGISSWKWLQTFAYVVFYLTGCHIINHAFLRPGRPEIGFTGSI
jgi:methionine sulfoxide reductase heme-binding subunit